MFNDAYAALFGPTELEMDALAKCNQFGRFPILPLSTTLEPAVHDGSVSDDSCSPITPLDAYNLNLHTLCYQKTEPFAPALEQCLPMSALYAPPGHLLHPSDAESSSSATDSSSPASEAALLPISPPIVPSQAPPASSKKRGAPGGDEDGAGPTAAKKPRVSLGRIRAKDFVPPDVSGLTKREARLVKNRAAAFLSRQRKREEFEAMEVRLAELERENEQLRRTSSSETAASPAPSSQSSAGDALEPMQLQLSSMRQLLQAAEEREQALKTELEELRLEPAESSRTGTASGSLGLMAVLSLSSVLKDAAGASSWARELALCDAQSGVPEIEVSCSPCTDGRVRVRLHRPTEQPQEDAASDWPFDSPSSLGFMDDGFASIFPAPNGAQKRVRLALASAKLGEDGAELEVEIR